MLIDTNKVMTTDLAAYPEFIEEDGVHKKLSGFTKTDKGFIPVYTETEEISAGAALDILLGGDGE